MGLLDRFRSAEAPDEESLAAVRGEINEAVQLLREHSLGAEPRAEVADLIREVTFAAGEVTTADLRYPLPEKTPPSGPLSGALAAISPALTTDQLQDDATVEDLDAVSEAVAKLKETLRTAEPFPYEFEETAVERRHGKPLVSWGFPHGEGEDTEAVAGPYPRKLMERAKDHPDQPLWIGTGTRNGRDASLDKDHLFRHVGVVGITGYGKSTFLTNTARQLSDSDAGLCFIDPKGDDSRRLMEVLPDHRTDDVVWIEPGSSRDRVSGFNFINVGLDPDDPNYETALSALVDDLVKLLGADDYWGPRMDRVARNTITAMNEWNRRNPDERAMNLVDLYYILSSEASRHEFAARVQAEGIEFVADYTETVAEMDDDDLEPLLGRFQPWIENAVARRMIGFRENEVDIAEAVESGKIIVVRMGGQPKDLKQMLGMAVVRRIWAAIRARAELDHAERDPFYLIADEFDNIAMRDEAIPDMLSESRSYRLSLIFCTQYLSRLPQNVIDAMLVNCDTLVSFNPGAKKEARPIAPQLDVDPQTLLNEVNFHVWMRSTEGTTQQSDAYRVYTHPPYPPVRSRDEASAIIDRSLDRFGQEKRPPTQERAELLFNGGSGKLETGIGQEIAMADEPEIAQMHKEELRAAITTEDSPADPTTGPPTDTPATGEPRADGVGAAATDTPPFEEDGDAADRELDQHRDALLEGIYAAQIQRAVDDGDRSVLITPDDDLPWVPLSAAKAEIEGRIGDTGYLSRLSNAIEQLSGEHVRSERRSGEVFLALTASGRAIVAAQDTGEGGSGGGDDHRFALRQSFATFTALGYDAALPTQDGDEQPDGIARTPIDPASYDDLETILAKRDELKTEYPAVWALSQGEDVWIEAETSTPTKPYQPIVNLRKAVDRGARCAFVCKDGTTDHDDVAYWARRIEQALFDYDPVQGGVEVNRDRLILAKTLDDHGNRVFYNQRHDYRLDEGVYALRPTTDSGVAVTWREDGDSIVAEDAESGVIARFESVDALQNGDRTAVGAFSEYDSAAEEYVVYHDGEKRHYSTEEELLEEWSRFKRPYIPEADFAVDVDGVSTNDFVIIVFPDADNPRFDAPLVYEAGDLIPLFEYVDGTSGAESDAATGRDESPTSDTAGSRSSTAGPAHGPATARDPATASGTADENVERGSAVTPARDAAEDRTPADDPPEGESHPEADTPDQGDPGSIDVGAGTAEDPIVLPGAGGAPEATGPPASSAGAGSHGEAEPDGDRAGAEDAPTSSAADREALDPEAALAEARAIAGPPPSEMDDEPRPGRAESGKEQFVRQFGGRQDPEEDSEDDLNQRPDPETADSEDGSDQHTGPDEEDSEDREVIDGA